MNSPLVIDYYSDVLCVWAWISVRKNEELLEEWGDQIILKHHYINLFGDTDLRMKKQWGDRGEHEGFARHVLNSAAPYDNAPVNSEIWKEVRPATSANAHLILKAVEIEYSEKQSASLAELFQRRFFKDNYDIGNQEILLELASGFSLDPDKIKSSIESGKATAALMQDYQKAVELGIKGSPSWIMNNGRQVLFGNVGYRVLCANVREILKHPEHEASWC